MASGIPLTVAGARSAIRELERAIKDGAAVDFRGLYITTRKRHAYL